MSSQTVIKFDDIFYLKHHNDQYLVTFDEGRYNFPQLAKKEQLGKKELVKLQLTSRNDTDNLKDGDTIYIRSLEASLGKNHILGAFSDSHNCYYWKDGYDDDKQGWQIHKVKSNGDVIRYGDEVYFTNVSYKNQRLVADTKYPGYLTTKKNAAETWTIESVRKKQQPNDSNSNNPASVFGLSVASGDPSDTGVVLWTRINPEKYDINTPLTYEVCESNKFNKDVINKQVETSFGEQTDYTVHVDLDGTLEPGKTYFYRFKYDGIYSKTGRCKTLPATDANIHTLRLAVITCNDFSTGYFNAFYHLAKEKIDYVVHLGDFAYEYSQYPEGYGEVYREDIHWENDHYEQPFSDSKTQRATSLENFQQIYRTYRQDIGLQAAMEQHTWMITLDDHEVADNWYWDEDEKTIVFEPGHPILKQVSEKKKVFEDTRKERANLYNNAIKAWQQYVPARLRKAENSEKLGQSNSQEIPEILEGLELRENLIYRHFRFGTLVDFFLTDSRSFRSKPDIDPEKPNPQATMLGENQKQWLIDGVKKSNATWKVWGNQTLLASAALNEWMKPELIDDWQAYKTERYEILQLIKNSETEKHKTDKVSNFVVFTGDMHTSMISYVKTDFEGKWNKANMDYSKLAGVEFMTPSVTSPGISEGFHEEIEKWADKIPGASMVGQAVDMLPNLPFFSNDNHDDAGQGSFKHKMLTAELTKRHSPHIEHYDSSINGYAIAEFSESELRWEVYAINKSDFDVADDGRKISKPGVHKHLAKTMKYEPNGIKLID